MKHKSFKSAALGFFSNKIQRFEGLPKETLPLVFKYSSSCVLVCVDRFVLDFLSLVYREDVGRKVCLFYDLPKTSSFEFINVEENIVIENDFFRIPQEKDL